MGSGIQGCGIRNPQAWNPESTAWNPEFKTLLDYLTWGERVLSVNLRSGVPYIFCRGAKVRLIQLLDYLSAASN